VRIKFREMGIGSLLLKSFFEATQIRQVKSVWLEVRESNFKAIKFYLREGFSFIQTRKNFYSNPSENAKIMKCDLSGHLAEDNR
jgi:ribosomal-protein-alanine N-acetyltransferase